jgi:hypothetical protein
MSCVNLVFGRLYTVPRRCVQLAWSAGEQSPTVWADLISKIKDGLLSALDNAVSSREEELKRSEGQRHMPGWNFCTYFILKVSLQVFRPRCPNKRGRLRKVWQPHTKE